MEEAREPSPVSVLEENGANSTNSELLITKEMEEEEQALEEIRIKSDQDELKAAQRSKPEFTKFSSKLDQLLGKARIYSDFLVEQMVNMNASKNAEEEPEEVEAPAQKGRGKRKAPTKGRRPNQRANVSKRGKTSQVDEEEVGEEAEQTEVDACEGLSEEEINAKEQMKIAPLLTGGSLKGYQLVGIKWIISLWKNALNGILADQMGLGKTVQTIGFIAHLIHQGVVGPFLILAPLSTLSNWISEIKKWMPSVPVLLYHGSKEQRLRIRSSELPQKVTAGFPIIVTSFEIALLDGPFLRRYAWKYLVVDEGHRLKNFNCKLFQKLKVLKTENVLLLSGTPLQNNLSELWSLLNFILPEIFNSVDDFASWFDIEGAEENASGMDQETFNKERREQVLTMLHQILRPFLLRRVKEDVEKGLPGKKEVILYATMTEKQRLYNEHVVKKTLEDFIDTNADMPGSRMARFRNVLMQLRKNCNHPDLFSNAFNYPPVEELISECGKLKLLDRLLAKIKANGHKVLIFSQMTNLLDILQYYLQCKGFEPFRIDGNVKLADRQEQINEFQTDPNSFIFLLSTRAGGLGINLTAADTVIFYDSDWNPHVDMQAMDRCHRIGQTKPVHVYRLATAHSVECRMMDVANKKVKLEHLVIVKGDFSKVGKDSNSKLKGPMMDPIALLRPEQNEEEKFIQSAEISDENMELLFDRSDLVGQTADKDFPSKLPPLGPGWKIVTRVGSQASGLSSIS